MRLNIKATSVTLAPAVREYLEKKLEGLDGLFDFNDPAVMVNVELGRVTRHKQGLVFFAEVNIYRGKESFRAVSEDENLNAAIDGVRERIAQELSSRRGKTRTLLRRGGALIKAMLRGGYEGLGYGLRYLGRPARTGRRLVRLAGGALAKQAEAGFGHAKAGWRYLRRLWRRRN